MCGIVGIASLEGRTLPTRRQLELMCATIAHRGPDDEGVYVRGRIGLGMRRLSIIDLAGGRQPIFNEDESVCTVFNGEIYNFRELRSALAGKGHTFRTSSDTEVIVHAYEEYGQDFPGHLNGMFAIAVADFHNGRLLLARDHFGIKPLYYTLTRDFLVWGSEIKAILASGFVDRNLDIDAVGQFLAWEYVPGEGTLLRDVKKLEPGCMLEVVLDTPGCRLRRYWDIPVTTSNNALSPTDWEDAIDAKLRECVHRQLVSDVPLGAFLSGGVDSSLIVAAMGPAKTFSIGFEDESYNELEYAGTVARHLGVEHINEVIDADVVDLFGRLMYFLDDPIGDFSIFPTYLVSALARRHVKVVLSGDGGDELFGGYETYLAERYGRAYRYVPGAIRNHVIEPFVASLRPRAEKKGLINKSKRFLEGVQHSPVLRHARWRVFMSRHTRDELFSPDARSRLTTPIEDHIERLFERAGQRPPVSAGLYVDVNSYLCDDILTKVDRMSMAVSLESRVPYLDKELVELAFGLPDALTAADGETKVLLKRVAARHVPRRCVYRPKEGFSIPIKQWLGTRFRPLMEELLNRPRIESGGLFSWPVIERLLRQHRAGVANHSHVLWTLMVFEAWRDRWLRSSTFAASAESPKGVVSPG